jgi:hypothetical protein
MNSLVNSSSSKSGSELITTTAYGWTTTGTIVILATWTSLVQKFPNWALTQTCSSVLTVVLSRSLRSPVSLTLTTLV